MTRTKKDVGVDLGLSNEEKERLHAIARSAIDHRAVGKQPPAPSADSEKLAEHRGAFVCVYKKGMLRGCIGSLEADEPLYLTIHNMAQAAAFRDPRFMPVGKDELPYLELEISVLTPLVEVSGPREIHVGKHGILIKRGGRSGLLLPQVATERNWDVTTFVEETCKKAGLPIDSWKDPDTKIYVFSADVF